MEDRDFLKKTTELATKISKLPKGYISRKVIGGKSYFYHQWSENGQKHGKYLRDEEVEPLSELIESRKALQKELRDLREKPSSQKRYA